MPNERGQYCFVSDQLPNQLQENKRQIMSMVKLNNKLPQAQKLQMTVKKDKLSINNQPYTKQIEPPKPSDILRMNSIEKKLCNEMEVFESEQVEEGGSKFVGYATKIKSVEEVKRGYAKLRKKHPSANHISCAYRLPGAKNSASRHRR